MNKNFQDGINFLSKLTAKRTINSLKIFLSFYLSKILKRSFHWGMPMSLSFEPTTSCNLRCPECPSGLRSFNRPTGMADPELFKQLINELHPQLLYLLLYFQGEPFLHPHFFEMIKLAHQKKIYTATSTNAHYLNEENARKTVESGLDRLIISIDGTTQETYEAYRIGGNLEKVIQGTKNIIKWKKKLKSKTPHVIFQFLVVRPNEHQIEEVKQLAKTLGVDEVGLKTAQIYNYENGSPLIPTQQKYARYKKASGDKYIIKSKLENHCWKMWHSSVVTQDGKIVPCCFDKDADHVLGSINKNSFKEVLKSPEYNSFRNNILAYRRKIEMCKNCTEGSKVWG
ncbi:radical SAM/SPASM domain-containing protein [Xanthovirga aplysinae]|uniref:radical SAM/SPASM domain-containing protein n=1 Tax=Xanthovirga aplysinae TaxID=2529853 RepID=UPI0012BB813A|nr:radical SAM/SPASM domain-containing protein [Xanthovirga aplysinae]MTI31723.1 radical SAM protein [Xanthovirga aplysinae]